MLAQLECKIPPVAQLLAAFILAYLLAEYFPIAQFSGIWFDRLALLLITLAVILAWWAIRQFSRLGTTVTPLQPHNATRLVTTGPLAWSRNPMYLAMTLALAGWIVYLGALSSVIAWAAFFAAIQRLQIIPEERALFAQFGQPYQDYCKRVRRWL